MSNVTLCTVAWNGLYATSLMWESFCKYHPRPVFFAYENGSTDGTAEYLKKHADYVWVADKNDYHGWGLDRLCKKVETEYVMTVDTDIEFHKAVVPYMQQHNVHAVHQCRWFKPDDPPEVKHYYECDMNIAGLDNMRKQWGFMVWCTLFKTKELQKMIEYVSFTEHTNTETLKFYDTGSMLYNAYLGAGYRVSELDLMGEGYITHFWNVTSVLYAYPDEFSDEYKETKYNHIKERLRHLRSHSIMM